MSVSLVMWARGGKVTATEQQGRGDLYPKGANLPVVPVG